MRSHHERSIKETMEQIWSVRQRVADHNNSMHKIDAMINDLMDRKRWHSKRISKAELYIKQLNADIERKQKQLKP